ncbi:ferrochelatase-like protein [Anopheles sinensis]|uniref:Ferrochelatase-like protein n=1 Tax=Anopheles sinensis TaxID=74873 RepID=A0A084WUA6_ANOSI|nr:ferrochelatase-like protein [Anopheles sinensis]
MPGPAPTLTFSAAPVRFLYKQSDRKPGELSGREQPDRASTTQALCKLYVSMAAGLSSLVLERTQNYGSIPNLADLPKSPHAFRSVEFGYSSPNRNLQ